MQYIAREDRYETMEYRRTGRSGLMLPAISLGFWNNFGFDRSLDSQSAIVRRAFDLGITSFDLANRYGPPLGAAEENFGRIFAHSFRPYRDEMVIATKAANPMWEGPYGGKGSRKHIFASMDASLRRLGLDYVDIFYSHTPDPETPIEETMGAFADIVRQGKALYVGISSYSPEQTVAAAAALAEHNVPLLIHQPRYNMFQRQIEDGLLETLESLGAGCIVFSPLAQGLLTNRYMHGIPERSRAAEGRWMTADAVNETYLERAKALTRIANDRGQSLAQLALTWVLRHPTITSALIGASSVEQLEDNVAAIGAPSLSDDELAAIEPYAVEGTAA
jgi:L-glyceraldehyde 3-phosphate reductase